MTPSWPDIGFDDDPPADVRDVPEFFFFFMAAMAASHRPHLGKTGKLFVARRQSTVANFCVFLVDNFSLPAQAVCIN